MRTIKVEGLKDNKIIDIELSQIMMGSGDFLRKDNMDVAAPILDEFIANGGTTFDTARHYRHSELALGTWMKEKNNRDNVVIFTKGCHPVREFPDTPRVNPTAIREDIEKSLEMLGTDHVELFALHRDDITQEVGPIMEALNEMIQEGKVYAIGTSNWETDRIIEANNYAKEKGLRPFTFNSPNLSLAEVNKPRWPGCVTADQTMIDFHKETQMPLLSWSSQAGGFFSGAFAPDKLENEEMVDVFYNDNNWKRFDRAVEMAEKKNVSPIQISLSFVLNQKFPTAAAIGSERIEELRSSIEGAKIELNEADVNYLNLED
ncbi:aldo/keto reductase [Erysipelothrix urinaevulpis]|uniref:aldo/keto reductase n=1 Tax=Erysipelothrix urinaevulpis TaxID=2683717 RepID=UPI00135AF376|nr:aldo/keto reductase [Erysipelothrix urinaevulpis]